mmetsp:Transcript_26165/g.28929  ORF Transcript_26165/g.28929 Transcript_26165/m.28929 type:complete len:334 (-) Transcript_26165:619-1620(-)
MVPRITTKTLLIWSFLINPVLPFQLHSQNNNSPTKKKLISSSSKIRKAPLSLSLPSSLLSLCAVPNRKSSFIREPAERQKLKEVTKEDKVVGAEFFGGRKLREDLFDPTLEAMANVEENEDTTKYIKWDDRNAFVDDVSQAFAKSLQGQINGILYAEDESPAEPEYVYSKEKLQWSSPLTFEDNQSATTKTPFEELSKGLEFYRRLDVAITSGKTLSSSKSNNINGGLMVELRWEVSVAWPNFWEARVLLTGKSIFTLDEKKEIIQQVDTLDEEDMNSSIFSQVTPRFWDAYHLGMGPSAELSPTVSKCNKGGILNPYTYCKVPPRLVYQLTL